MVNFEIELVGCYIWGNFEEIWNDFFVEVFQIFFGNNDVNGVCDGFVLVVYFGYGVDLEVVL